MARSRIRLEHDQLHQLLNLPGNTVILETGKGFNPDCVMVYVESDILETEQAPDGVEQGQSGPLMTMDEFINLGEEVAMAKAAEATKAEEV